MVALAPCPSCQWGDHEGHIGSWKPAPPGIFGGFYCNCQGDCEDKMSPLIAGVLDSMCETDLEPEDLGDKWKMGCFTWDKEKDDESEL